MVGRGEEGPRNVTRIWVTTGRERQSSARVTNGIKKNTKIG